MSASINKVVLIGGAGGSGSGDVVGPASATDNAIVRFDGTTGEVVQNSAVTIADTTGAMTWATGQAATLTGGDSGASLSLGAGTSAKGVFTGGSATGMTLDLVRTTGTAVANTTFAQLNGYNGSANRAVIIDLTGAGAADSGQIDFWTKATGVGIAQVARLTTAGNLLVGTTTDIAGSGGLHVAGTGTASTTTTGAFRVGTNVGLSGNAGGASYFGGAVTHTLGTNLPPQTAPASPASGWVLYTDSGDGNKLKAKASTGTVVTLGAP